MSSHVTEPETTTNNKKKKKHNKKNKVTNQVGDRENNINASSASVVVVPDVFCGPGIGLNTDAAAAAVDRAVLSTRPVSPNKMNQREVVLFFIERRLKCFVDFDTWLGSQDLLQKTAARFTSANFSASTD